MQKLITFFSFIILTFATSMSASAAKKCADFRTQSQAQSHYKKLKRANKTGWKSLDRNKDGVACECLKTKSCSKGKSKAKTRGKGKKNGLFGTQPSKSKKKATSSSYKKKSTKSSKTKKSDSKKKASKSSKKKTS